MKRKTKAKTQAAFRNVRPADFLTRTSLRNYRGYHRAIRRNIPRTAAMKSGWRAYMTALRVIYARSRSR